MSWLDYHAESEKLAAEAEFKYKSGDHQKAAGLYADAAASETKALESLDNSKKRTIGISAISSVSLWYKALEQDKAQSVAFKWLASGLLPDFATAELKEMLPALLKPTIKPEERMRFAEGKILVSIRGGEIVKGGAPLDLIVAKVGNIQSIFYRTAEFLSNLPHRKRGVPSRDISTLCKPWLFQAAPGSYQFYVVVQEPPQQELFPKTMPKSSDITDTFMKILRASIEDPDKTLVDLVSDKEYRGTFLKLTRSLAPTGKKFEELHILSETEKYPITLVPSVRSTIGDALKRQVLTKEVEEKIERETLRGLLRALHLDKDWLELSIEDKHIKVLGLEDEVDDIIGPMVNKTVLVETYKNSIGEYRFIDIQLEE